MEPTSLSFTLNLRCGQNPYWCRWGLIGNPFDVLPFRSTLIDNLARGVPHDSVEQLLRQLGLTEKAARTIKRATKPNRVYHVCVEWTGKRGKITVKEIK